MSGRVEVAAGVGLGGETTGVAEVGTSLAEAEIVVGWAPARPMAGAHATIARTETRARHPKRTRLMLLFAEAN
jgi:hypothetical protein